MKILIVDDHEATVVFMRMAFAGAGHTVATASDMATALTHAVDNPPDVVLTDLTFGAHGADGDEGAGGGLELARALRTAAPTRWVGLLAVSGADTPQMIKATTDHGFDGFVAKPVNLASLLDRVHRLADVVAARRASQHQVDGP